MITKEEATKLMEIPGEARGVTFKTDAEFVKIKGGLPALTQLEEELKRLGYPIDYAGLKATDWFSFGLRLLSLTVIKEQLNLDDQGIKAMGDLAPKHSFIIKFLTRYFISPKQTLQFAFRYWRQHFSVGELSIEKYDEKLNQLSLRIKGVTMLPIFATYLEGYFIRVLKFVLPAKNINSEILAAPYKGDETTEIFFSW